MADNTTNFNLEKPLPNEYFDINIQNKNMDTLDTEIAKKASSTEDGRMSKEDKQKLDGIEDGAINYVHPNSHPANIITEDNTHRFVTDTQITNWDGKVEQTDIDLLAGVGRTTETVKKNADDISTLTTQYTASDILAKLKTVDGSGSGLDADTVDGWDKDTIRTWTNILGKPSTFAPSAHGHAIADITSLQATLDEKIEVVSGEYIGDGTVDSWTPREIILGFQPKAVFVFYHGYYTEAGGAVHGGLALPGVPVYQNGTTDKGLDITANGFNVYRYAVADIFTNNNNSKFSYLALK